MNETVTVTYVHERPGLHTGNIIWAERDHGDSYYPVSKYAPRRGIFPPDHPACPNGEARSNERAECGDSPQLRAFRALGYWASCFPEGDGITMQVERGQDAKQVMADIAEVFGWKVKPHK